MYVDVSEQAFEDAIETGLLRHAQGAFGEERSSYLDMKPGGYNKRNSEDYDTNLCLIPRDVLDFVLATQPKQWARLTQHHGKLVEERFLKRLSSELRSRGALDVLRNGIKDMGCLFRLAYFRPASGLNEETRTLYLGNFFSVVRQLYYSEKNNKSLDLALFLNGIPIFTAELKNPLTGQSVLDAIHQYRTDRDPREPLLAYGRCLAHFAIDPELVYVTTHLAGNQTRFLPFNQGKYGGAGNPPVPLSQSGYPTSYLWEETWAPDSILDLVRQFIYEVQEEDEKGKKTGKRFLIFPRYQQLDCVRKLTADAREQGTGRRYLIQHSAGSGKTFTIAWLAHQLSTLHGADDRRVFESIVVISDRRVLDRQLQTAMRQFEQTLGVVENIDTTSRQLKEALESGKTIIVTTLQKFPVIAQEIGQLPGQRFALIVDEAHSSQSGEGSQGPKAVLASASLEEAEVQEAGDRISEEEELDNTALTHMASRKQPVNVSTFAFTATPKSKTLELFGERQPNGSFVPFHLYSMRQAIEEGFILDVLESYTTYKSYWKLIKTIEDDPSYDKAKAAYLLKAFVDLHPHAIDEKVRIMVEHFMAKSQYEVGGKAKAMIVTRSRLHAVRYKLALDRHLEELGSPFKALVAFSGTVQDGVASYTESGMNGIPEVQTAKTFEGPDFRLLVVANKFQTGFDQPLLQTMYVDKKLGGVNAVQTLSRLNRVHPDKSNTMVLDFNNEADDIQAAFQPYYETTILSEATDPNLLYEIQTRLKEFPIFTDEDVGPFAQLFFSGKATQDQIYAALSQSIGRFSDLQEDEQRDFRSQLADYVKLYSFLAQVLTFLDADLEKLYVFARHLRRLLKVDQEELPLEIQQKIDMESYRIQEISSGKVALERSGDKLEPMKTKEQGELPPEELEALSRIISDLNERFGIKMRPEHRITLGQMMERLEEDTALEVATTVNTMENVRITFDHKVEQVIQDIVDQNFELYKRITDDPAFGEAIKNHLFDQYLRKNGKDRSLGK